MVLAIGMIEYFVMDFMRANEEDKPEDYSWQKNIEEQNKRIKEFSRQRDYDYQDSENNSGIQYTDSRIITQNNDIELQRQKNLIDVKEQQNKTAEVKSIQKKDFNHLEFHR